MRQFVNIMLIKRSKQNFRNGKTHSLSHTAADTFPLSIPKPPHSPFPLLQSTSCLPGQPNSPHRRPHPSAPMQLC